MENCKEYLEKQPDGTYALVLRGDLCKESDILVPEGAIRARFYPHNPNELEFENAFRQWWYDEKQGWFYYMDYEVSEIHSRVVWQRATHPEELPFIDDEPKSINDQYAEIEQVRQQEIDATLAERQSQYGCYEDVAHVTQQILSALRIGNYDELPAPMKESLHMIASKMARIVIGDPEYLDNWHDIGGYAKLIEKLIKVE